MTKPLPTVGVLALQGSFNEHLKALERLGIPGKAVRNPEEAKGISALIIPGGESTTIKKLMEHSGMSAWIRKAAARGMPIYGTCAGAILLADMGLIDMAVKRNAYGRQRDSFEAKAAFKGTALTAIFIRAPRIVSTGKTVEVLMRLRDEEPILVKENNIWAGTFHPELTDSSIIHEAFIQESLTKLPNNIK